MNFLFAAADGRPAHTSAASKASWKEGANPQKDVKRGAGPQKDLIRDEVCDDRP